MNSKKQLLSKFNILKKYIKKGDTIYLETDLIKFNPVFNIIKNKKKFLNFFLAIFKNLVGKKGNIIVPAFSYSWGKNKKNKIFVERKTEPETGIFSKFLFKNRQFVRTADPMFSFLIYGKDKSKLVKINNDSFGKESIFHKINNSKTKLVSFGINRFDPTFVHFVEQYFDENIKRINYRYRKKFKGYIENPKNKKNKKTFFSFVKNENKKFNFNGNKIFEDLSKKKMVKSFIIFDSQIHIVSAKDFFNIGIKGMRKNIHYFVKY